MLNEKLKSPNWTILLPFNTLSLISRVLIEEEYSRGLVRKALLRCAVLLYHLSIVLPLE